VSVIKDLIMHKKFEPDFFDALLDRSIDHRFHFGDPSDDTSYHHEVNSLGSRGKKELERSKLLAAGCSQTFGMGVPEGWTWPSILATKLGVSYTNIGSVGASVQGIVGNIISYIEEIGAPEVICVVFPQIWRYEFGIDSKIIFSKKDGPQEEPHVAVVINTPPDVNPPNLSKRPHEITEIIGEASSVYLTSIAIRELIHYCRAKNIKLLFSSWDIDADSIFSRAKNTHSIYSNYLSLGDDLLEFEDDRNRDTTSDIHYKCHTGILDKPKEWVRGLDQSRHMGAHQHLHYAELFERHIREAENNVK